MDRGYDQAHGQPADPVSLFIEGHLEDAGVYMARPVPFALDSGTVYEVDQAGMAKGIIDLLFARHLESANLATVFDEGWFGYGSFKAPTVPKPVGERRAGTEHRAASRAKEHIDDDPDRPHLIRKPGSEGDDAGPSADTTAKGKGTDDSASTASGTAGADDDPDRPHLTRHADGSGTPGSSGDSAQGTAGTGSGGSQTSGRRSRDRTPVRERDRCLPTTRIGPR